MSREVAFGLQLRVRSFAFSLHCLISLNSNKINKISVNGKRVLSWKAKPETGEPVPGTAGRIHNHFPANPACPEDAPALSENSGPEVCLGPIPNSEKKTGLQEYQPPFASTSVHLEPAILPSRVLYLYSGIRGFRKETNSLELLRYSPALHPLASSSEPPRLLQNLLPTHTDFIFSRKDEARGAWDAAWPPPTCPSRRSPSGLRAAEPREPRALPGPAGDAGAALTWAPAPPGLLRLPAP